MPEFELGSAYGVGHYYESYPKPSLFKLNVNYKFLYIIIFIKDLNIFL